MSSPKAGDALPAVFEDVVNDIKAALQPSILKNDTPRSVSRKIIAYLQDAHDLSPNTPLFEFLRSGTGREGTLVLAHLTLANQKATALIEHERSLLDLSLSEIQRLITATKEQRLTTSLKNEDFDKQFLEPLERHAKVLSSSLEEATSRQRAAQRRFYELRTDIVGPLMTQLKNQYNAYSQAFRTLKQADNSLNKLQDAVQQLKTKIPTSDATDPQVHQVVRAVGKDVLFPSDEDKPAANEAAPGPSRVAPTATPAPAPSVPAAATATTSDSASDDADGPTASVPTEESTNEPPAEQTAKPSDTPTTTTSTTAASTSATVARRTAALSSMTLSSFPVSPLPTHSLSFLQALYSNALLAQHSLQHILDGVQHKCSSRGVKVDVEIEDLLPLEQALELAVLQYNGDFSRLVEVTRSRVVCPRVSDAVEVVSALAQEGASASTRKVEVLRVENLLNPGIVEGVDGDGGYRHTLVLLRVDDCHVCQLAIHVSPLLSLRPRQCEQLQAAARTLHLVDQKLSHVVVPPVAISPEEAAAAANNNSKGGGVRQVISNALERVAIGTCQSLHINNVTLTTEECKVIHKALRAPSSVVQDISLPKCGLTSALSRILCTGGSGAPKTLGEFRFVDLNNNSGLLGECVAMFVSQDLEELSLHHCSMDDLDIEQLSEALARVKPQLLTKLNLMDNVIGESGSRALGDALTFTHNLVDLNLQGCKIGSRGVCALVPALSQMPVLTNLDLRGNEIGPEGVEVLVPVLPSTGITSLDLRVNNIGATGAKALGPVLPQLKAITSLSLGSNCLEEEGAKALAEPLSQLTQLTTLHLRDNKLGIAGAKALVPTLSKLQLLSTLNVGGNEIGIEGMKALVHPLSSLRNLTSLSLEGNKLETDGAKALAPVLLAMPGLKHLGLGENNFGPNGIKALVASLKTLNNVTSIDVSGNAMKSAGAKALAGAISTMPHLVSFFINDNVIGVDGVKALIPALTAAAPNMLTLGLGGNDLGADGAKAASRLMTNMKQLQTLGLDENRLGPAGMKALVPALTEMTQLTTLALAGNYIGPEGVKVVVPIIITMPRLATLYIEDNQLGQMDKAWIQASVTHVSLLAN